MAKMRLVDSSAGVEGQVDVVSAEGADALSVKDVFTEQMLDRAAQQVMKAAAHIVEFGVFGRPEMKRFDEDRLNKAVTAVQGSLFEALKDVPDSRLRASVDLISTWREVVRYSERSERALEQGSIDFCAMEAEGIFRAKARVQASSVPLRTSVYKRK